MARDHLIHLGYEVGSGEAVEIPLRHMAVTGQTQESGKTTTLEALISRCPEDQAALAFITKRGEGSFPAGGGGHRVMPYFRDRADWHFVTSIIDATLQEKNKFLRPWIMRICRTTKTLAEVQRAVREALKTAKGINEGVYTQLDAYLDMIVPEIQRASLASELALQPGLNVMNVSSFATPMQMLFVQSAIDWVNEREHGVIVIVPEAWEFIPEGKGSPVKNSAISLVRKGAGLRNYIWVDSQDMAGVDKTILRGCTVWLIGVQREANEIKRNLSNIPAGIAKPKAKDIAMQELGQFVACWKANTIKTYVQPAWMSMHDAQQIAMGVLDGTTVSPPRSKAVHHDGDSIVNEAEARELREANQAMQRELDELRMQLLNQAKPPPSPPPSLAPAPPPAPRNLSINEASQRPVPVLDPVVLPNGEEAMYQRFKSRLVQEAPALIRLCEIQPTIEVTVQRPVLKMDEKNLEGRTAKLLKNGWFQNNQTFSSTLRELERTGPRINNKSLSEIFKKFVKLGVMTKEGNEGYKEVAGIQVKYIES